ncbi:MAG: hypothetical protein IKJ05_07105 [Oscillospiraceae bacterium]|nr:hypothetical protein [Oscillospiraceae bacterium]
MNENLKEKIKMLYSKTGINIMLTLGLLGVIMLTVEDFFPDKTKEQSSDVSLSEYRINMEKELEELLSIVSGAGKVEVMITLESGQENIYAWQEKTSTDEKTDVYGSTDTGTRRETYENEIVMVNSGSNKAALIEKTMEPVVQGVVVVCEGADDVKVISNITNAVSVALNVTSNRICVIKMS